MCSCAYGKRVSVTNDTGVVVPSMSSTTPRTPRSAERDRHTVTAGVTRRGRDVRRPEAKRLELRVDAALGVVRRPSGLVLEQPDRANAPVAAEVEPMMRSARHANQVSGDDLERKHGFARRVDVEEPATVDDEAHLVFVVPVFAAELLEHGVEPRRLRR